MKTKAFQDLVQLSDESLFEEVADGLKLIFENSMRIYSDACQLADKQNSRGHRILCLIAEEEAAKYLILLDAIRCQRKTGQDFSRQLKKCNDHLAKGIYTQYAWASPSTFGDIRKWVDDWRREYYLDGPNDVDWVLQNSIVQQREEAIYVDYANSEGKHIWLSPSRYDDFDSLPLSGTMPPIIELVRALNDVGFADAKALSKIASIWRSVQISDELNWYNDLRRLNIQTLEALNNDRLLKEQPQAVYEIIVNKWLFPLYPLELEMLKIDKSELYKIQEYYWAREFM